jgi:hypothetical protein
MVAIVQLVSPYNEEQNLMAMQVKLKILEAIKVIP